MSKRNLSDWFEGYKYYCHDSEPPTKYHEWSAVSIIAAAMQRKCKLVWGSLTYYPNFFIVLTGPAGQARKGTALRFYYDFITDLNVPIAPDANSPQALIQSLTESADTLQGDGTESYIETHSSLTVISPEFTVFLGYANREFMSLLCDFYDCRDRFIYRTISRGTEEIIGIWLNIIGCTTPELIQAAMPVDIVGSGLTSRIIFVFEPRIKGKVPCPFFTTTKEGLELRRMLMEDLHQVKALSGRFKVDRDFINLWTEFYTDLPLDSPFDPQRFNHYWSRRPSHVTKLSMIFSVSRSNDMVIRKEDLERAIVFIGETERKMPQAFAGVGRSDKVEVVNDIMAWLAIRGECTYADLARAFYRDIKDDRELDGIVRTLRKMRFITVAEKLGTTVLIHIPPSVQNLKEGEPDE